MYKELQVKQCPKCHLTMMLKSIGPVTIDECGKCEGVWFDKDELRQSEDVADKDFDWMDFEIWKHADQFSAKSSSLKCPVCKTPLHAIHYGETQITIDYCPACKGTWLDKGEFKKIVKALEDQLLTQPFSEYVRDAIQEAKEFVTGEKSLISGWKDLCMVLRLMQYRFFVEHPKVLDAVINSQKKSPFV
jgi:Zn-finger nucleic acid-binding protein